MIIPPQRKQISAKAREYLGTPFQHQGRLKGKACDCVGLPYCVGAELGLRSTDGKLIDKNENLNYQAQPTDNFVQQECQRLLVEKPIYQMQEGDVLLMKMPTIPCHVGIVTRMYVGTPDECFGIIHSYSPARKVVERSSTLSCRTASSVCLVSLESQAKWHSSSVEETRTRRAPLLSLT
jgi:hypothetical protein